MAGQKAKEDPEKEERRKEIEKQKAEKKQREKGGQKEEKRKDIQIVRILETSLNGNLTVAQGIRHVRGIGFMYAKAVSNACPFANKKLGEITEAEEQKLEDIIFNPLKYNIPSWLVNRRKDPETGQSLHFAVSQLQLTNNTDINKMKKMKSYKGVRHIQGLPVRGQRTRSTGRAGKTIGVAKKKAEPAKAPAKK